MTRRRPRCLLNAATAVSIVLCAATVVLWVRSYCLGDLWSRSGPNGLDVVLLDGRVIAVSRTRTFVRVRVRPRDPSERSDTSFASRGWTHEPAEGYSYASDASTLGFTSRADQTLDLDVASGVDHIERRRTVALPLWLPAVGFGAVPAIRFMRRRARRNRSLAGHCPTCAYDLRATPDRCPECGTVPPLAG